MTHLSSIDPTPARRAPVSHVYRCQALGLVSAAIPAPDAEVAAARYLTAAMRDGRLPHWTLPDDDVPMLVIVEGPQGQRDLWMNLAWEPVWFADQDPSDGRAV